MRRRPALEPNRARLVERTGDDQLVGSRRNVRESEDAGGVGRREPFQVDDAHVAIQEGAAGLLLDHVTEQSVGDRKDQGEQQV